MSNQGTSPHQPERGRRSPGLVAEDFLGLLDDIRARTPRMRGEII